MTIPPQSPSFGKKKINIVIISANAYCVICKLKKAQVFAISMRNLEQQSEKKAKKETNPKSIILKECYNLLDVFPIKEFDTFLFYQKYDHKISLRK